MAKIDSTPTQPTALTVASGSSGNEKRMKP